MPSGDSHWLAEMSWAKRDISRPSIAFSGAPGEVWAGPECVERAPFLSTRRHAGAVPEVGDDDGR